VDALALTHRKRGKRIMAEQIPQQGWIDTEAELRGLLFGDEPKADVPVSANSIQKGSINPLAGLIISSRRRQLEKEQRRGTISEATNNGRIGNTGV
jgi:hypothetical protein